MEILKKLEPEWVDIEHGGETLKFLLAPLTAAQRVTTVSIISDDVGEAFLRMARYAIKGWEGVTRDNKPVPFSTAELAALFDHRDSGPLLLALGNLIGARGQLSEDDEKKS